MEQKLQDFVSSVQAIASNIVNLDANTAQLVAANATLTTNLTQAQTDRDASQAQVVAVSSQLDAAKTQIATDAINLKFAVVDAMIGRKMTVLAGLHLLPADPTTNKEQANVWIDSGGHTAQSNPGTNTTPHGTFTYTAGTPTAPARPFFTPGAPWDNLFLYEKFPFPALFPNYLVQFRTFSMTAADRAAVNCIEWQDEIIWNGNVYNMGWQWNFSSKLIRYFDFTAGDWKPTKAPFVDLGASPVPIVTEMLLDDVNKTTTHGAITIGGVRTVLNLSQAATPRVGATNKYTISFCQMDSNGKGTPFGVNIHNCETRYM
jgi:hypothetical protein